MKSVAVLAILCAPLLCGTIAVPLLWAQASRANQQQVRTFIPPAVYMHPFITCPSSNPCTRTGEFRVDRMPKGCCVLSVMNGDGHGTDEVQSYEIFLNGDKVLSGGGARFADKPVTILAGTNSVKVVLVGEPHSKVLVQIVYDPRKSR